jgi:hypothetical protein
MQGRTVFNQRCHLADIFERLIVTNQRALAVFTDGKDRRDRLKFNRRAAGRAGGRLGHELPEISSVF